MLQHVPECDNIAGCQRGSRLLQSCAYYEASAGKSTGGILIQFARGLDTDDAPATVGSDGQECSRSAAYIEEPSRGSVPVEDVEVPPRCLKASLVLRFIHITLEVPVEL